MAHSTRTPTPNSMVVLDGNSEDSDIKPRRPATGKRQKLKRETSGTSLEILPPEDKENDFSQRKSNKNGSNSRPSSGRPDSATSNRPGSSATRAPPIRDSPQRRPATPGTPSRSVSLQTIRRKEDTELNLGPLDWKPSIEKQTQQLPGQVDRLTIEEPSSRQSKPTTVQSSSSADNQITNIEDSDEFDTDLEDGGEEGVKEEEEKPKAPTELMLEFLDTVYRKDWNIARNLCKMILLYEPDNAEANTFAPLIEEKIQLDAEPSESEGESGESDDSDSDDGSDDDDSSSENSSDAEYNAEDEDENPKSAKDNTGSAQNNTETTQNNTETAQTNLKYTAGLGAYKS